MTKKENKEKLRRIWQIIADGSLDEFDQVIAEDVMDHTAQPGQAPGLAGVKDGMRALREGLSDRQVSVKNMIAEDDKVAAHFRLEGTHKGPFRGIPASGNRVIIEGIEIVRFEDGKAVERWAQADTLGMMQQMEAMPAPE